MAARVRVFWPKATIQHVMLFPEMQYTELENRCALRVPWVRIPPPPPYCSPSISSNVYYQHIKQLLPILCLSVSAGICYDPILFMGKFVGRIMAHGTNRLSARTVEAAKSSGLTADGGGLYLQVSKSGAKSWLYRFMLNGRAREMGLGSLKAVSLANAREKAALCRSSQADGIDPIEARKAGRSRSVAADQKTITFEDAADAYIAAHEYSWKNAKHASQWHNTLAADAYPIAGRLLVSDIDTEVVMQILRPIWGLKPETAGRLIPTVIDQNPCAHLRMPRDMIFHGWSMRLFQAWQHSATMSS